MDFSFGELARRTQVKVPTIRYYEQIGLLPTPLRTEGQQRRYDKRSISRLAFIGVRVNSVLTLRQSRASSLQDDPDHSCSVADGSAQRVLLKSRNALLACALRTELQRMLEECASGRVAECRVIEALADNSHRHGRLAEN